MARIYVLMRMTKIVWARKRASSRETELFSIKSTFKKSPKLNIKLEELICRITEVLQESPIFWRWD
jgi:hypothetical protein